MRYIIIIILVFSFYFKSYTQVNHAEVNYKIRLIPNKVINTKPLPVNKLISQEVDNINMLLLINKNSSMFKEKESMAMDSKRQMIRKMAKIIAGLSSIYHYDIQRQEIIREQEFDGKSFNIVSKFSDLKWKLVNETKVINDYKCFKATTTKVFKSRKGNIVNQEVIAWYAPKIPISLGPKNYVGLPGLIMELYEGKNKIYYVHSMNLNPKKEIKIRNLKKGERLTETEYANLTEGSTQQLINSMKN